MATNSSGAGVSIRHLEFREGTSSKFWKIELNGSSHTVTFGRIGTAGQTQTKEFDSDAEAKKSHDKLVAEKVKKGYVDAEGAASASGSSAPAANASTAAASPSGGGQPAKKSSAKKSVEATSSGVAEPPAPEASTIKAPVGPAAAPRAVFGSQPRELALDPGDWNRAGFRPRLRKERVTPRPFDRAAAVARVGKLKTHTYGWEVDWKALKLPEQMTSEEAQFWLYAMTVCRDRSDTMSQLQEKIADFSGTSQSPVEFARERMGKYSRGIGTETVNVIANLLTPAEMVELIRNPVDRLQSWQVGRETLALVEGFQQYVVPFLTDEEITGLQAVIRRDWDPGKSNPDPHMTLPPEYYLAAALRMPDEVQQVVSSWDDQRFRANPWAESYQYPHLLVFALATPADIEREWRRLDLAIGSPEIARGFLACTEYSALDIFADFIVKQTNKDRCEELLNVLTLVRAPEAAVPMLTCRISSKTPAAARDWLDTFVGHGVTGLLPTAAGRSKLAEPAIDYLRSVRRAGHTEIIERAVAECGDPAIVERIRAEVLDFEERVYEPLASDQIPAWLREAVAAAPSTKPKSIPGWAAAPQLPPLIVGDRRVGDEHVAAVVQAIIATPVGASHPLLAAVRREIDRHVRDAFAWRLFQAWLEDGAPANAKWAMGAIGHLGDDASVLKITPLIRNWPGESQNARAVFGLECLRAIGSNVALMQLSGIAQKLKFKALKAKAEKFVEEIAKERGLSRSELEDRVIPDCGLDERGRREFSFGPRAFSFVLGSDLKAMVKDSDGKVRPDLPKPTAKDDEETANASLAEWKLLKKQIKEVATIQAGRLEGAMVTGRRWTPEDFETLFVKHSLMTHLAQKLIWGFYDQTGQRQGAFRVTEERDYADVQDEPVDLSAVAHVGIVHPLEMEASERAAWGEVLGDYEIVTPFPQLGREVFALTPDEESVDQLLRYKGLKIVAPTLVFTLEKLGWTRGTAMDGGCFDEHSKQFPAANVTAVVNYEGTVAMGYIDPNELLTLEQVVFVNGMRNPSGYGWGSEKDKLLTLGKVPPIVISEVLADLQVLKGKAK